MRFRNSPFIDFNTGQVKTPPMVLIHRLGARADQSLEQMLMVFECRVDVWQLGPAVEMLKLMDSADDQSSVWAHSGYSLIAATFTYFEMVGKILNPGSNGWRTSKRDFNHGFCDVYPQFAPNGVDRSDPTLPDVVQFRDRVRNGMYHLGYTKSHLYIHNRPQRWREDFAAEMQGQERYYFVNPHAMTRTIVAHFPTLMRRLKDQSIASDAMRAKFREFYLKFHMGAE